MKNASRLVVLALAAFFVAGILGCGCGDGSVCGSGNTVVSGPSGLPSPSPSPSVGATPDPCLVKSMAVAFHSGAQLPFLAPGATEQLDATAFNDGGEVAKGCNVSREPSWAVLTPTTCTVLGSGWNPFVKGLRVGACSLTASVVSDNRTITSAPFTVEVR